MEHFFFFCGFLLFIIMVAKSLMKSKPAKLPPGPRKLPIIGNIHQLLGSQSHRILADLAKKYGPLMHLQVGEVSTIVISSAEVAEEVLKKHDIIFASRAFLLSPRILFYDCTDVGFCPYGEYWRQLRKICAKELLSSQRTQTFRSIREAEVLNMIKAISKEEGLAVDFGKKISTMTYSVTALAAFGKRSKYHDDFMSAMEDVVKLMAGFCLPDMYPSVKILETITGMRQKLERLHKRVDQILENILIRHRVRKAESEYGSGEEKEDLVDVLLKVQKSGEFGIPLTDDNLKAVIFDVFGGGGETSSTTTVWAMAEMIKNPAVMKKAQAEVRAIYGKRGTVDESQLHELKYLHAVIKETLRLHPPASLIPPRECGEQCEIFGYEIPAKSRVYVNLWAIGRDPGYWTEPEKFIPERFLDSKIDFKGSNFNYIPFGAGRRICPGMSFALPMMELPLAQSLFHFDWKLPGALENEELDMTDIFGLTVGRKHDLFLVPTSYHPSSKYQQ
ncbi:tabersonine 16-hydroxylase 2-like [Coffea eugenioides]|uniref:tabersonine 16-hydroxylase 2-like n=1 Tax=Coffea eugenioides TaxID=49369 RepID=UPI000F60E733|nr:tabersonine 16-hydroxylase 2-like [Coffea eugenioides]